jgi:tRNA(fMet)-specific endonuclease VapC
MIRYMLDTNMVSHLIRQHPVVVRHVVATPMASLCLSAITAGELWSGQAPGRSAAASGGAGIASPC